MFLTTPLDAAPALRGRTETCRCAAWDRQCCAPAGTGPPQGSYQTQQNNVIIIFIASFSFLSLQNLTNKGRGHAFLVDHRLTNVVIFCQPLTLE